jgi:hypothetical protein
MATVVAVAAVFALGAVLPGTNAVASTNNAPSTSTAVNVGVPFSGNWPGTVLAHGSDFNHWWRVPSTIRPGDTVDLAVDNRGSLQSLHFCLVPPVDDFGAEQAIGGCSEETYISGGRQDRVQLTYSGTSGQGYLISSMSSCCRDVGAVAGNGYGQYTVVIERIVTKVTPGLVVPAVVPASFSVAASMVYGDNAPVVDGVGARLEWRYQPERGKAPSPFTPLSDTFSAGGSAVFNASLPQEARGRAIQLRACAAQPGGSSAICTADQKTSVEVGGPSPTCVKARALQRTHGRKLSRLKTRTRRLKAKRAVVRGKSRRRTTRQLRRTKRKVRTAKRRFASSRRNARTLC